MLRACNQQRFLRAEMTEERRFVYPRHVGDLAGGRAALAFAADHFSRGNQDSLARLFG